MSVIDSLVVELGLDPTKFTKGQRQALDAFKKTKEEAVNSGKAVEEQSKKSFEALGGIKTQALELFAAIGGATAIVGLATKVTTADAAVGRLSRNIGVSSETISKWQGVARIFGGDAQSMAQTFTTISDAVAGFKIGKISPLIADLRALSSAGGTAIDVNQGVDQTLLDISANLAKVNATDPARAGLLGRMLGLDPGLYDLLVKGPAATQNMLDAVKAMGPATKEATDAAGELAKAWNSLELALEGKARKGLNFVAPALATMLNTVTKDLTTPSTLLQPGGFGSGFKKTTSDDWWEALKIGFFGRQKSSSSSSDSSEKSPATKAYRESIASIESKGSGGYAAVGPVTRSGDRAFGRYQIMGNNIGEWSQDALGKRLSVQEFMASPESQDAIFDHRFGQYVKQFGNPQDAASAWLTGKPLSAGANLFDQNGTSGAAYAARFTAGLPAGSTTNTTVSINGPITINAGSSTDGGAIASKFTETIKRQSFAAQANDGQN
jgi:hypothetical protein